MTTTLDPASTCGGVDHGAEAGQHAAGDQRGDVERHVVGDRRPTCDCVDHDVLGEGAGAHAVDDRLAAARPSAASAGRAETPPRRTPARRRRRPGRSRSCGSAWRRRDRRASAASRRGRPPRPRRRPRGRTPPAGRRPRRRRCRRCRCGRSRRRRCLIRTSPGPGSASSIVSMRQRRAEGAADGGSGLHEIPRRLRCRNGPRLSCAAREFKRRLDEGGMPF